MTNAAKGIPIFRAAISLAALALLLTGYGFPDPLSRASAQSELLYQAVSVVSCPPARQEGAGCISGIIVDPEGRPLVDMTARIVTRGATSRADGTFLIVGVPSGQHTLEVSQRETPSRTLTSNVQVRSGEMATVRVVF